MLDAGHRRVLVFAATVQHARTLSAILVARDVRSNVVTGLTPVRVREHAIRTFKSDDEAPMVLVNFGVLTTGFDAPTASAVVIARPTQSLVLFSQMVGRAIRGPRAGGTETCEVVTVVDPEPAGLRRCGGSVSELGGRMAVSTSEVQLRFSIIDPGMTVKGDARQRLQVHDACAGRTHRQLRSKVTRR